MKTGTIYGLLCPVEKRVVYVGQSAMRLCRRLAIHKSAIFKKHSNSKRINWLRSLSEKNLLEDLMIVCLQDGLPLDKLTTYENMWIEKMLALGELVNTDRKNNLSRPSNDEDGIVAYRKVLDNQFITSIRRRVDEIGIKGLSEVSGVSELNISIAIHEGIATSTVRFSLAKSLNIHYKGKWMKGDKWKNKNKRRAVSQKSTGKVSLKRRPDAEQWINSNEIMAL